MEIFISWSGERSKTVAEALRDWLPKVIQRLKPWMSESDIDRGSRGLKVIADRLQTINFGIICLTPENLNESWILFEAGALSKSVTTSYVCPILLDMNISDLKGPLAQFQAIQFNKSDLFKLLTTINRRMKERMTEAELKETYEVWWSKLEDKIRQIPQPKKQVDTSRTQKDILQEILSIVRGMERTYSKKNAIARDVREIRSRAASAKKDKQRLIDDETPTSIGDELDALLAELGGEDL